MHAEYSILFSIFVLIAVHTKMHQKTTFITYGSWHPSNCITQHSNQFCCRTYDHETTLQLGLPMQFKYPTAVLQTIHVWVMRRAAFSYQGPRHKSRKNGNGKQRDCCSQPSVPLACATPARSVASASKSARSDYPPAKSARFPPFLASRGRRTTVLAPDINGFTASIKDRVENAALRHCERTERNRTETERDRD